MASKAVELDLVIEQDEVKMLISYFSRCCYRAQYEDDYAKSVMQKCVELAKLDYNVSVIDNSTGDLCAHYPSQLILLESENNPSGELINSTIYEGIEPQRLREYITKARSARCRTRFPMPVIFYQGKYICRSATLSGGPEIYGRSGFDFLFAGDQAENNDPDDDEPSLEQPNNCNNWVLCDQVRKEDIKLLKALNIGTIVDLMVENKKVKFGLNVTSSEKVDKEKRYSQFTIVSLPYPGCEFFREFRDQNYSAENLYYNWGQTHVDAEIIVPQDNITERVQIKWNEYKNWNLPSLTENYLKLLLGYVFDSSSGVLVHCISGWDRTPLFISLLRICLWADGSIHKSLTPIQMLYFTIAYDWLLFGHNLQDRKNKGEDIFYFCFHFLKFVMGDEFSSQKCRTKAASGGIGSTGGEVCVAQSEAQELEGGELIMYSQGSNHSLDSSWSSISSKSQEINPSCQSDDLINMPGGIWMGEGGGSVSTQSSSSSSASTVIETGVGDSRLRMSHTSPVSVPSKTNARQRNESTSSLNVGSVGDEIKNIGVETLEDKIARLNLSFKDGDTKSKSETPAEDENEVSPCNESDSQRFVEPNIITSIPTLKQDTTLAKEEFPAMMPKFEPQNFELAPPLAEPSPVELPNEESESPLPFVFNELLQSCLEIEFATEAIELIHHESDKSQTESPGTSESTSTPELPATAADTEPVKFQELEEAGDVLVLSESVLGRSWQYVSTTGSLRSTASGSTVSSNSRSSGERPGETTISDSVNTLTDSPDTITDSPDTITDSPDSCFISQRKHSGDHSQCGSTCAMRRERLDQIRKLFSICYCQSIGHNLKDGSEASGISNIFGNIAGKIMKS